jgi:hypothetical protein
MSLANENGSINLDECISRVGDALHGRNGLDRAAFAFICSALSRHASKAAPFQERVQPWMTACFGSEISADRVERNDRFTEESLELGQACGMTRDRVLMLVDYVYGRPVGEPAQEVGGVMVTLAALCLAHGMDMHEAAEVELARIWTKVEAIRAKQQTKPRGSPLPVPAAQPQSSKEADAAEKAAAYDELNRIAELHGFASAAAAIAAARRAAQQVAARDWIAGHTEWINAPGGDKMSTAEAFKAGMAYAKGAA